MPATNPNQDTMTFTPEAAIGAASTPVPDEVKQKLQEAVKAAIKDELAKPENGGVTAAGHAKSSISW
jgi:hypothetical protein